MADVSLFSVQSSSLTLGAVLARGSPGVTVYHADMQLGKHATKVCLGVLACPQIPLSQYFVVQPCKASLHAGGSQEVAHKLSPSRSSGHLS